MKVLEKSNINMSLNSKLGQIFHKFLKNFPLEIQVPCSGFSFHPDRCHDGAFELMFQEVFQQNSVHPQEILLLSLGVDFTWGLMESVQFF